MAEELKKNSKAAEDLENKEPEKIEIEDILAESEEEVEPDLDIEEAISEDDAENSKKSAAKEKIKTIVKEKVKKEKSEKKDSPKEEKRPEDKNAVVVENNTNVVKKKSLLGTIALIILTVLVTTAAVLGAVWWFYQRGNVAKPEEQKVETKVTESAKSTSENVVYVNATDGLKLRKEPSSTSEQLAVIPYGTALTVLETQGDWIKTTYQNQTGWVFRQFTTSTKPFDASWKTYSGSGYDPSAPKFTIKYPSDWSIADYKIEKVDAAKTYKIAFGEGGHGLYEDETVTSSQENVTYNGNPAKKTIVKRSGAISFISVQFQKSTTISTQIEFWVPEGYNPSYLTLFEQILSTINFQ